MSCLGAVFRYPPRSVGIWRDRLVSLDWDSDEEGTFLEEVAMGQPEQQRESNFEPPTLGATSADNRAHSRHDWENDVQVAWLSAPKFLPSPAAHFRAQNLSLGGIGLRARCMVHRGQIGVILLGQGSENPVIRGIEVIHCEYDESLHTHVIGCCWTELPDQVEAAVVEHDQQVPTLTITLVDD